MKNYFVVCMECSACSVQSPTSKRNASALFQRSHSLSVNYKCRNTKQNSKFQPHRGLNRRMCLDHTDNGAEASEYISLHEQFVAASTYIRAWTRTEIVTETVFCWSILDCTQCSYKTAVLLTRQLSYRKENRAMRPIYGCTEKFWESSLRTRLLFQKFVMNFCSDWY